MRELFSDLGLGLTPTGAPPPPPPAPLVSSGVWEAQGTVLGVCGNPDHSELFLTRESFIGLGAHLISPPWSALELPPWSPIFYPAELDKGIELTSAEQPREGRLLPNIEYREAGQCGRKNTNSEISGPAFPVGRPQGHFVWLLRASDFLVCQREVVLSALKRIGEP